MTLTGQVFTIMGNITTTQQTREIVKATDQHLWDQTIAGYRLNTDFKEVKLNLGRAFGFAYGHKENGAMFSHMAVMYANALYQWGLVHEGYKIMEAIYRQCQDFEISRMYPGIPEYIDPNGRGMYTWLTGSASWYLLTLVTEVFGVRGLYGDLVLNPKLVRGQFDDSGTAAITTLFAGKRIKVIYRNTAKLEFGAYQIGRISIDGEDASYTNHNSDAIIPRNSIESKASKNVEIEVALDFK
jgi:cellobiose phosphorylase